MVEHKRTGPLAGIRIVEFSGMGPVPHAAMLLSDLGAEVLRVERPGGNGWPNSVVDRGRYSVEVDIRSAEGRERVLEMIGYADVVIEGYRPGVMERLGFGPDVLLTRNARLIYGRMTGWGQTGPMARTAGHDINYIALTGALAAVTDRDGLPIPPLNLVGDFGGGSLYLALGIASALFERERSGLGQVIDAAVIDGAASLMAVFSGLVASGQLSLDSEKSMLGGAAPFYRCYQCSDGKYISVGAVEPHFYALLLEKIGGSESLRHQQNDWHDWRSCCETLAGIFRQKTQNEWCALLQETDACFTPVLTLSEADRHPHMQARGTYLDIDGVIHPAPAPRFSRTPCDIGDSGGGDVLHQRWMGARHLSV